MAFGQAAAGQTAAGLSVAGQRLDRQETDSRWDADFFGLSLAVSFSRVFEPVSPPSFVFCA